MRAVVGISSGYEFDDRTFMLKESYVRAIVKAGGLPIVIPAVAEYDIIQSFSQICDGLVLSGGEDADPCYWGELPDKELGEVDPLRDFFEIELARTIIKMRKPVLGICRGCQILNIAAGGSIVQNIKGDFMHRQKAPRNYAFHPVFIQKDSKLAVILKTEQIKVNSFHHQAVNRPGQNIRISACASDGNIEAIEFIDQYYFGMGIQWHPECMDDLYADYLFKALVDASSMPDRFRHE